MKAQLPLMRWAQDPLNVHLSINLFDSCYHKLHMSSVSSEKGKIEERTRLFFISVERKSDNSVVVRELDGVLHGIVDASRSGQNSSGGWLRIILRKKPRGNLNLPLNKDESHIKERLKQWRENIPEWWPCVFQQQKEKEGPLAGKKIDVDWARWNKGRFLRHPDGDAASDDDEEEFDASNEDHVNELLEMMRKNGEWTEAEDKECEELAKQEQQQMTNDTETEDKEDNEWQEGIGSADDDAKASPTQPPVASSGAVPQPTQKELDSMMNNTEFMQWMDQQMKVGQKRTHEQMSSSLEQGQGESDGGNVTTIGGSGAVASSAFDDLDDLAFKAPPANLKVPRI